MIRLGPLRGRFALARNAVGRVATVAGTGALATGAFTHDLYGPSVLAALGCAGWGAAWSLTLRRDATGNTAMGLYMAPSVSMAALLTAQRIIPGIDWYWELLADAGWTAAVLYVRPARVARVLVGREKSLTPRPLSRPRSSWSRRTSRPGRSTRWPSSGRSTLPSRAAPLRTRCWSRSNAPVGSR